MTPTDFRREFVASFGIENANAILAAALEHKNGVHDDAGSDKLRWAILICIGHECVSRFHEHHGITCPWPAVREWLQARRDYIAAHDGDVDYLAMLTSAYNEIMPCRETTGEEMETPTHALQMWIIEDTIRIRYPDGQLIAIPAFEPSRLVAILRSQVPRPEIKRVLAFAWPEGKSPYKAANERGAAIREREEARKEREKRARMKRIEKRDRVKAADEILKLVGMM